MKENSNVMIIGGGISGLVNAYSDLKQGKIVTLRDEKSRLGGMIQTLETPFGLVETAANGLLNSYVVENLIQELGIKITHHKKASKRRYFFINGKMRRIPVSIFSAIRGLMGVLLVNAKPKSNETMEEWGNRIFGSKLTYNLVEPALGGIYATPLSSMDPRSVFSKLPFETGKSLFQNFRTLSRKPKPKIRGLISFEKGMQDLVSALVNRIQDNPNMKIELNQKPIQIDKFRSDKSLDELKICLPISSAYHYCQSDPTCRVFLEKFNISQPSYYSVASITRFSNESIFSKPAFGVLFPKDQGIKANGILSNDSIFPNRILEPGLYSETWIYSGDWLNDITETELSSILEEDRKKLLRKSKNYSPAKAVYSKIWKDSFPVYDKKLYDFNQCLDEIEEFHNRENRPIRFYGNYRRGIGLRSLIESAMDS